MTTAEAKLETEPQPPWLHRPWRLLLAGAVIATLSAAAILATRRYDANSPTKAFQRAIEDLKRGHWNLARTYVCDARLQATPQASFLRGAMLLDKGYFYPALDELGAARVEPALDIAALTLMAEAWYRLGRHVEAQAALQEVLKQKPDSVEGHRWLAASYYDLGDYGNAVTHLKRTAELDPADARPLRLLGLIYKDFSQLEEAIPAYQESLSRDGNRPDAAEIRLELASCQLETRRYREALATLVNCSDLPEYEVLRAECLYALGDLSAAKATLAHALERQSDNLAGLNLQGSMLLEGGEAGEAIKPLRIAVKTHPKDYASHFKLSQAYGQIGEQKLAEAELQTAQEIRLLLEEFSQLHAEAWERPRDVEVRLRLAELAKQLDRPEMAEVWLRSASALRPVPSAAAE